MEIGSYITGGSKFVFLHSSFILVNLKNLDFSQIYHCLMWYAQKNFNFFDCYIFIKYKFSKSLLTPVHKIGKSFKLLNFVRGRNRITNINLK